MDGSICLSRGERKTLLAAYRNGSNVHVSRRAHIVLLLGQGRSYREIGEWTFASNDLIAACARKYRDGGVAAVVESESTEEAAFPLWLVRIAQWLMTKTPQDFGYFRSRWSCDMLAEVLAWETGERICGETVRLGCAEWALCGGDHVRSSGRLIPNTMLNSDEFSICWHGCQQMRPRSFRTRSMCI